MSAHRGRDDDVRDLVVHGVAWWTGPSPRASQSRWAAGAARPHPLRGGLAMAAAGLAALVLGAAVAASTEAPHRAAATVATVAQAVSGVVKAPAGSPASAPAAPAPPRAVEREPASSARHATTRPPAHWPPPTGAPRPDE